MRSNLDLDFYQGRTARGQVRDMFLFSGLMGLFLSHALQFH